MSVAIYPFTALNASQVSRSLILSFVSLIKLRLIPLLAVSFLEASCTDTRITAVGPEATYHYTDWRSVSSQEAFDVAPYPVGGMSDFVKRISYPKELRRLRIGDRIVVVVSLDTTGGILEVHVPESKQPEFKKTVIDAVRSTRWSPAMKNHIPIAARFAFSINFVPQYY